MSYALVGDAKIVRTRTYREEANWSIASWAYLGYKEVKEFVVEWSSNGDADGADPATHEATYETDGYLLVEYGRDTAYATAEGTWQEIYRKKGAYTAYS